MRIDAQLAKKNKIFATLLTQNYPEKKRDEQIQLPFVLRMQCILLVDFVTSISFHNYAIYAANIFTSAHIKVNHCEPFWYDADGRKLTVMVYKHLYCYESFLLLLFASSPMEFVATLSNDEFYRLRAISSNLSFTFFSHIRTDTRMSWWILFSTWKVNVGYLLSVNAPLPCAMYLKCCLIPLKSKDIEITFTVIYTMSSRMSPTATPNSIIRCTNGISRDIASMHYHWIKNQSMSSPSTIFHQSCCDIVQVELSYFILMNCQFKWKNLSIQLQCNFHWCVYFQVQNLYSFYVINTNNFSKRKIWWRDLSAENTYNDVYMWMILIELPCNAREKFSNSMERREKNVIYFIWSFQYFAPIPLAQFII